MKKMQADGSVFGHLSGERGRAADCGAFGTVRLANYEHPSTAELNGNKMKKLKWWGWCGNCLQAGMKCISFRAIQNGNGYVQSSFVSGDTSDASHPGVGGLIVAGVLLTLTATFMCLMLLGK